MVLLFTEKYKNFLSQVIFCLALLFLAFASSAHQLKEIKSAVAPEFVDGLAR